MSEKKKCRYTDEMVRLFAVKMVHGDKNRIKGLENSHRGVGLPSTALCCEMHEHV